LAFPAAGGRGVPGFVEHAVNVQIKEKNITHRIIHIEIITHQFSLMRYI
jgi:hypothetical protein